MKRDASEKRTGGALAGEVDGGLALVLDRDQALALEPELEIRDAGLDVVARRRDQSPESSKRTQSRKSGRKEPETRGERKKGAQKVERTSDRMKRRKMSSGNK